MAFQTVDTVTDGQVSLRRDQTSRSSNNFVVDISLGSTTSKLLVENAQYPDHDGIYACTGSNQENSSTALINIQVIGTYIRA